MQNNLPPYAAPSVRDGNSENIGESASAGMVFRDLAKSTKDLVEGTLELARAEVGEAVTKTTLHAGWIGLGAALGVFAALALGAALILFIGEQFLGGNYALSALIVGAALAGIGVPLIAVNLQRLKKEDISLFRTQRAIRRGTGNMQDSAQKMKSDISAAIDGDPRTQPGDASPMTR